MDTAVPLRPGRIRALTALGWTLGIVALALLYGPALREHMVHSRKPYVISDDVRTWVYPLERYREGSAPTDDYLGDYALACTGIGVRGVYWLGTRFASAADCSKVLPYVLLFITCAGAGVAAAKFGGPPAAWLAVSLCLSTGVFLERMTGGLPRSFGFPVLALGAAALAGGRITFLCAITVAGAALYPASAVPCGLALALVLTILPAPDRGQASSWPAGKRVLVVGATAAVAVLMMAPNILELRKYGPAIGPRDYHEYPEAGPEGRPTVSDRPPYDAFLYAAAVQAVEVIHGPGPSLAATVLARTEAPGIARARARAAAVVAALAVAGFLFLTWREAAARRLGLLIVASGAAHFAAGQLQPFLYFPPRYVTYPIPIAIIVMVAAAAALGWRQPSASWLRRTASPVAMAGILASVAGLGSSVIGYTIWPNKGDRVYPAVRALPKDALIGGWPNLVMDGIPYFSNRRVLVSREAHLPFHRAFADELRRRMYATIDASFSDDLSPLLRLRDEFGVTHFVVDRADFNDTPPDYFQPFQARARAAYYRSRTHGFAVLRLAAEHNVYDDGDIAIIDLRALPAGPADRRQPP